MAKIIVFNMLSIDGYYAGPNGEINWHNVDAEFNDFAIKQLGEEVETLIFGRVTYELMASYWPTSSVIKDDPIVAKLMNESAKIVFSTSLKTADWNNTKIMNQVEVEKIKKLRAESNKNIFIFGSGKLVQSFAKLGLIDEYRLMINPLALGSGKPLFTELQKFNLIQLKEFKNRNVLLYYQVIK